MVLKQHQAIAAAKVFAEDGSNLHKFSSAFHLCDMRDMQFVEECLREIAELQDSRANSDNLDSEFGVLGVIDASKRLELLRDYFYDYYKICQMHMFCGCIKDAKKDTTGRLLPNDDEFKNFAQCVTVLTPADMLRLQEILRVEYNIPFGAIVDLITNAYLYFGTIYKYTK